jgi:DNA ligase-1
MKWIEFCRINQLIELKVPTTKISKLKADWEGIDNKEIFLKILCLDLEPNNLKTKKATKWLTNVMNIFEDELEMEIYTHGDIGEAIYFFDDDGHDSEYTLSQVFSLLEMDCSKSDGESYRRFSITYRTMSSLERKWFVRYMLRTPRNGVNIGTVRKLISKIYDKPETEIKKYAQLHDLPSIALTLERGEVPSNRLTIGRYIAPMLAKPTPKEKWPKEYLMEYKYDGARYQVHKGRDVIIFNRKGKVVTNKFPDVVETVNSWNEKVEFIIDTEIYPVDGEGNPEPFKKFGTRIHSKNIQDAIEKCPVKLAVFDCMMYDVENLMDLPLRDRLEYITKFPNQAIRDTTNDNDIFYNLAINDKYEGIMVKDLNGKYDSGKRSNGWAKYKPPRFDIDVVVTSGRYGEGKRATVFGSFDISVKDGNGFTQVGSIGTGFSEMELMLVTQILKRNITSLDKSTYSFSPRVVLEVTCDLVTQDADGNYGLRFPRLIRIRDDKPVSEINTLDDLLEMMI